MDEKDIPLKVRKDIWEHLAMAEYALFYVKYLLNKVQIKKKKKVSFKNQ